MEWYNIDVETLATTCIRCRKPIKGRLCGYVPKQPLSLEEATHLYECMNIPFMLKSIRPYKETDKHIIVAGFPIIFCKECLNKVDPEAEIEWVFRVGSP